MLSVENPPPDPPCPCEISLLKSSSHDRASDKLVLQELDLLKPGVDVSSLPKFSIRDYVFSARSKDIKTNWPFSQKNLQLCLKHGVKDPLPPFQPLDSVRNQPFKGYAFKPTLFEEENVSSLDGKPSELSDHVVLSTSNDAPWNPKPAAVHIDTNLCRSGGEKHPPSTATIHSQSEVESDTPNALFSSAPETATLLEAPVELEAAAPPPASQKIKTTTQHLGKKCRLVVRLGATSDPISAEDITSNCTALSEAMTSKLCPVCKTFSSSSNTTLNAHIDQCLSVESTSKWVADSKLTRHRIKPRKTRMMVDICATAPACTLEELDRRNGSSWATDSNLPTQNTEVCTEIKRQRLTSVYSEDNGDEGAVYIDANGTKLRILSKFNDDSSVLRVREDTGLGKFLKKGKGSKLFSTNKKRHRGPKHHKYLKVAHQSKKIDSPETCEFEICAGQDQSCGVRESFGKKQHLAPHFKVQEQQVKAIDSGTLRPWVCSKRTGLSNKINSKNIPQGYKFLSCHSGSFTEGSYSQKCPKPSKDPIPSPESRKRGVNSKCEAQVNGSRERSPRKKRARSPLFGAQIIDNVDSSLEKPKAFVNKFRKHSTSVHDTTLMPQLSNFTKNHTSSRGEMTVSIHDDALRNSYNFPRGSRKSSQSCHQFSSESIKFSGSKKNALLVCQSSMPEIKADLSKKYSVITKPQVHFTAEIDELMVAGPSEVDKQFGSIQNHSENESQTEVTDIMSLSRGCGLEIRQDGGSVSIPQWKDSTNMKCSQLPSQCYGCDMGENTGYSSVRVSDGFAGKFDGQEFATIDAQVHEKGAIMDPSSKIGVKLSESIAFESQKLAIPFDSQTDSLQSVEKYEGSLHRAEGQNSPAEASLIPGDELFCADKVGNDIIRQDTHMVTDLDSRFGHGNSFAEVDPIPIPGPPGSYLPSPRDMSSEDFQGNSSLTTSRVHSSQDQHEMVDGELSDSLISANSTISNSTTAKSDMNNSEQLSSVRPHAIQDNTRSGFLGACIDRVLATAAVPQTAVTEAERAIADGEYSKLNLIIPEKGQFRIEDDDHPCCCSRKERSPQHVAINYQEPQLLRHRTMAMGNQLGCNRSMTFNNSNARLEMFSLRNCVSSGSEKVVPPVMRSAASLNPAKISSDTAVRFPSRGDCDSASPSASSPILRLMGKNLMVVNKDEDVSIQAPPIALNDCPNPQFLAASGVSPGNNQKLESHSAHLVVPRGPIIFSHDLLNRRGECFDARFSKDFRNPINSKTSLQTPVGMFLNKRMDDSYAASLEPREYEGDYSLLTQQSKPKERLDNTAACNMKKVLTNPDLLDLQHRKTNATGVSCKEIIVIDDFPESEANSTSEGVKHNEGLRVTAAGVSTPVNRDHESRRLNPFAHYGSQDSSPLGAHNISFHVPSSSRAACSSPTNWACTSGGSIILRRNPFMTSSTTGHLKPALNYSPSLS